MCASPAVSSFPQKPETVPATGAGAGPRVRLRAFAATADLLFRRLLLLCGLLAAALHAGPAAAQSAVGATASPAQAALSLAGTQSLQVSWTLDSARGTPVAVRSTEGRLIDRASGRVLALVPTVLALTAPGRVQETVRIDRERLADALAQGVSSLAYQRSWSDGAGSEAIAQMRIAVVGAQYGGLQLQDLRLRFDDGNDQNRVVEQGGTLSAYAELSYSGRGGFVEYEWLLADPTSTRSEPVFFRIGQNRIAVRGPSPLRIPAPPLPTVRSGPHLLQLRLREPEAPAAEPTLAYYVRPAMRDVPASIRLLAPTPEAQLLAGAEFRWSAVPGAGAYQLELYEHDGDERLTGVLLPAQGETLSTPLTAIARQRLAQGCRCRWRVLAYDAQGDLRGISGLQPVLIPPQGEQP